MPKQAAKANTRPSGCGDVWEKVRNLPIHKSDNTHALLVAIGLSRTTLLRSPQFSVRSRSAMIAFLKARLEEQERVSAEIKNLITEIQTIQTIGTENMQAGK